MILDSDLLIWYLRRHPGAATFIDRIPLAERNVSTASFLEIMYGCRSKAEVSEWRKFVTESISEVLPLTEDISLSAMHLMEEFVSSHHMGVIDSLIAATALSRGESLATCNIRHFRPVPGLTVKPFRP